MPSQNLLRLLGIQTLSLTLVQQVLSHWTMTTAPTLCSWFRLFLSPVLRIVQWQIQTHTHTEPSSNVPFLWLAKIMKPQDLRPSLALIETWDFPVVIMISTK